MWGIFYALFGGIANRIIGHFTDLRKSLLKSRMKVALEAYVSFIIFITIMAGLISFIISYVYLAYILHFPLILILIISIPISILSASIAFAATYSYPSLKASTFATRIEDDLPYAISHMAVMATAGATPEEIIRSVASIPKDAVAEFMSDVVRDIDLLGMDIVTALEAAKERSPSRTLEEFLSELSAIIRSGGDVRDFLISYGRSLLSSKAIEAKEFSETLSTLAEVFIILMVVFPLLLIIMFSIMALLGGTIAGISIDTVMMIMTYIVVPAIGIAFLIILDQVIPKGE